MSEVVLVTEKEFQKGEAVFRAVPSIAFEPAPAEEQGLAEAVRSRGCRGVVVGIQPYRGPLYEALAAAAAGRGALLARFGVGHDSVDKAAAKERNILVTNTPGVLDIGVAEHALWLLGNLVRHVGQLDAKFHAGEFAGRTGSEVHSRRLVVVGFGPIGRRVALMAHFGFGMQVTAVDTRSADEFAASLQVPWAEFLARHGVTTYTTDLDRALASADVVSLHIPSLPQTRHLFNARRLALLPPTALLINTARGAVLDEAALFDALSTNRLAGAALDVFEHEPYRPVDPRKDLRTLENTVLTPHVGSNTRQSNERMARSVVDTLTKFLAGDVAGLPRVDVG